jgi:bifunctional DNA-binding transcriptional regulator/antitoxin component of YhaV-PrlF toxin-antitoxin module
MTEDRPKPRPLGAIRLVDERGYAYIPRIVREELGVKGRGDIPFIVDANCVVLVRKDASLEDILEGLKIIMKDLELRSRR